jgi:hypothetical protein
MFIYNPSYFGYDGSEGVGFPSVILYGVNSWVVIGILVCEGLVKEFVVAICEFNELSMNVEDGILFVDMCI